MLPNERQLITDLFDRMRSFGPPQKDAEADALISQLARQNPDAGYMLVQSVLVQEQALQQTQSRVEELEQRVRELETVASRPAPQPSGGGSFLGGLFGGGSRQPAPQPAARATSVPAMGAAPAGGPWGARPGAAGMMQQPQAAAGGGFMRSAMATAAGVAGGMLAANAISGMLGGNAAHAAGQSSAPAADTSSQSANEPVADNNDPGNDPGAYQETYDEADNSWDAGGGGDMDI